MGVGEMTPYTIFHIERNKPTFMKTSKFIFTLCIVGCALFSCNPISPEEKDEMKKKALELATYLTDNYTVGDSVFFERRINPFAEYPDMIEGFVVTQNYFSDYSDYFSGEDGSFNTKGYQMGTVLQNANNKIEVKLFYKKESLGFYSDCFVDGRVIYNDKVNDMDRWYATEQDSIILINTYNYTATLQKNAGVIDIHAYKEKLYWNLAE